jgi:hypothetical protein
MDHSDEDIGLQNNLSPENATIDPLMSWSPSRYREANLFGTNQ